MLSAPTDLVMLAVQWGVVFGVCLIAAGWDLTQRRIPNMLVLPVFFAGLAWGYYLGGWSGLGGAFIGSIMLMVPYVLLFALAGGGAGDAKLMAAIGAWLGIINGLLALAAVSIVAVVVGVAVAVRKKKVLQLAFKMGQAARWIASLVGLAGKTSTRFDMDDTESIGTLPYAVVIATGVCLAGVAAIIWQL